MTDEMKRFSDAIGRAVNTALTEGLAPSAIVGELEYAKHVLLECCMRQTQQEQAPAQRDRAASTEH